MYLVFNGACGTVHPKNFRLSRPNGFSHHVLLNIHSDAVFIICGKTYFVKAGSAVLIKAQTSYEYYSESTYSDDWLHFDTTGDTQLSLVSNIPFQISHSELYSKIIRQILWENSYSPDSIKAQNIQCLFSILQNHMLQDYHNPDIRLSDSAYQHKIQAIRLDIRNQLSKDHSITQYAKELSISPSYFQHLYKEAFGISFQKDLILQRIEYAKDLLSSTTLSVKEIAEACGYHNEVHFHRQFKELVQCTPAKYRVL